MAAFDSKLGKADTSFASAGPIRAPADTSGERDQMIAQAIGIGAKAAGSAYAKSQAGELSGTDMSLADANQQADVVDAKIEEALAAETELGPVNPRRAAEIKDAALSEFATNDRTLVALRDRGSLSTIEARARRTLNLKRALSNPINSMFRQDFINAAKDLTGGSGMDDILQETPEEKAARELSEKKNEAIAKYEAQKTDYAVRMGVSEEVAGEELQAQQQDLDKIAKLNGLKAERELNQFEQEEFFASTRSSSGREIAAYVKEYSTANGGKGLMPNQIQGALRMTEGLYQKQLQALQTATGISGSYRDAEIARLKSWRDGQSELIKAYDANTLDKAEIEQLELAAQQIGWQNVGALMAYKAIDPRFFDIWMRSGGNLRGWVDRSFGGNAGTNFEKAAKALAGMNSWVMDGKAQDPAAVAAFLNTPEGTQYLSGSVAAESEGDAMGAPKVSDKTAQIYADQTETSLKSFTSGIAIMTSQNNPQYRGEVLKALDIATGKFDWLNKSKGGNGEITVNVTQKRGRRNTATLNLPDGLQENADEIKQLYRVIEKQPWVWEHVQDEYVDAADAFNGLMRGEWQPELNTEPGTTAKRGARGTRIKTEAPADTGTELKAPDTGVREADEAELRSLMEAELAGDGAPTPEQEARLLELLEQRVAIRDRERTGGKPVDPRTEMPEQNKVEIGRHGDSNWGSISKELFKFEGGFQDDPEDRGNYVDGKLIGTNKGISAAQYKTLFGSEPTKEKLMALTDEQVEKAYKEKYWDANRVGEMPPELQEVVMNMFVMTSPKNVVKAIQRASGAKEDGIMGPQTLKAMRGVSKEEIWEEYHKYLKSLKNYSKFGKGWRNRYEAILNS